MFDNENKKYDYFLVIERTQNLTKAAELLYITQPALSKFLVKLEEEIGQPLFYRNSVLELTPAGQLFKDYIQKVRNLQQELQTQLQKYAENDPQNIALGISTWRTQLILPNIINFLNNNNFSQHLSIQEASSANLNDYLASEKIDILFSHSFYSKKPVAIKKSLLYRDQLCLLVPSNYLTDAEIKAALTNPYNMDFKKIPKTTLINHLKKTLLYTQILQIMDHYDVTPNQIIETGNFSNAIELVKSGFGITLLPYSYYLNYPRSEKVTCYLVDHELFNWDCYLYWIDDKKRTQKENFVHFIRPLFSSINEEEASP